MEFAFYAFWSPQNQQNCSKLSTITGLLHVYRLFSNEVVKIIIFIQGNENFRENELIGNQSFIWWNAKLFWLLDQPLVNVSCQPWTVNWVVDMFLNNTELNSQIFWGKAQLVTSHDTLRKHPTFRNTTTVFPMKCLNNISLFQVFRERCEVKKAMKSRGRTGESGVGTLVFIFSHSFLLHTTRHNPNTWNRLLRNKRRNSILYWDVSLPGIV